MARGDNAIEFSRRVRHLVEVWSEASQFETPKDFVLALEEALDELTLAAGKDVPEFPWVNA